jgi:starvation-inducible DNA-binding protein
MLNKFIKAASLQMSTGISDHEAVIRGLKHLQADLYVLFFRIHNAHWNLVGKAFMGLHEKYGDLYAEMKDDADAVAERIRMLNGMPLSTMKEMCATASLKEIPGHEMDARHSAGMLKDGYQHICVELRPLISMAGEDEATKNMLIALLEKYEKHVWMLAAVSF